MVELVFIYFLFIFFILIIVKDEVILKINEMNSKKFRINKDYFLHLCRMIKLLNLKIKRREIYDKKD